VYQSRMGQFQLTFFRFFGQDVTLERVLSFNLSASGEFKAFFSTRFCFHFWHDVSFFIFF